MSWLFDTIKGRVLALLVLFFSLSHVIGLWLYVQKNEEATTLLHTRCLLNRSPSCHVSLIGCGRRSAARCLRASAVPCCVYRKLRRQPSDHQSQKNHVPMYSSIS